MAPWCIADDERAWQWFADEVWCYARVGIRVALVTASSEVTGQSFFTPFKDAQHPRATVVMCADSRVHTHAFENAPDGDLFVIRNIGNQVTSNRGSVEYGIRHLHTPLLLIIGHVACGAVKAALGDYRTLSNDTREPLDRLHLALDNTRKQPSPGEGAAGAGPFAAAPSAARAAAAKKPFSSSGLDASRSETVTRSADPIPCDGRAAVC